MENIHQEPESTVPFGDYDLVEEIARGGMGIVYRARQRSLQREVAIKLMRDGAVATPQEIQRFLTEAAAAAKLRHPHIVAIHEVGVVDGRHFFAMDLIDGENLAERTRDGPLPPKTAAALLLSIAQAVQHAHESGILHRDLKPSNVLIDSENRPFVTDFGLARPLDSGSSLTLPGQVLGTPGYMPPEQAAGGGHVGVASDTYSLGALLYHLLTGRAPFVGGTVAETLRNVLEQEPIAPQLLNPSVPLDLACVCLKCLAKSPSNRYPSAASFADDLQRFLSDRPTLAKPAGQAERFVRWTRRQPALTAAIAAAILLGIFGFIGVTWQWRRAERARVQAEANALAARQNLYAADMLNVQQALTEGDISHAVDLLLAHEQVSRHSDLRGWEWSFLARCCLQTLDARSQSTNPPPLNLPALSFPSVTIPVFAPDSRSVAYGNNQGAIEWWDLEHGTLLGTIRATGMNPLGFVDAGRTLVVASVQSPLPLRPGEFGGVEFWDLSTQTLKNAWSPPQNTTPISAATLSPDGKLVATGDLNGNVIVRTVTDGAVFKSAQVETGRIWKLAFSPDSTVLTICQDETAQLWTIATGQLVGVLGTGATFAFSPDGQWAATGYYRQIRIMQPGGKTLHTFLTPANSWLAFSQDGKTLACANGSIELWNVASRRRIAVLLPNSGAEFVQFSPDGTTLIGGKNGDIHVWKIASAQEVERLFRTSIPSALSPKPVVNLSHIPKRDSHTPRNLIDLSEAYNAALTDSWCGTRSDQGNPEGDNSLSDLTPGIRRLADVDFDIRGLIQLGSRHGYPRRVAGLRVAQTCRSLHFIHSAMFGFEKKGAQVGSYIVHYADGRLVEIPIVLGETLDDWWGPLDGKPTPQPTIAWKGSNHDAAARRQYTRLFKSTWRNPRPDQIVESIDFVWAGTQCSPFLIAITAE